MAAVPGGRVSVRTFAAQDTITVTGAGVLIGIDAGTGSNTLIGATGVVNTWRITDLDAGLLNTTTALTAVENLTGNALDDAFVMAAGQGVSGGIVGGGGVNSLSYAAYTSSVSVNLIAGSATGAGHVSNIRDVMGGSGDDLLIGNAQNNQLWGGLGNDILSGLDGNDVLHGEQGRDLLIGGRGSDLLGATAPTSPQTRWATTS